METRKVTVLTGTDGRRPGGARRPGRGGRRRRPASSTRRGRGARSTRAGCPPWRRTSSGRCPRSRRSSRHLGLEGEVPDLGHEVVLHGDPMLVVRTGGPRARRLRGVDGARPRPARRGHPARPGPPQDRRPGPGRHPRRPLAARPGRRCGTGRRWACSGRAGPPSAAGSGPTTPIPGVYAAGAHATPGGGLPFVGLSASLVAQVVGPAER